MRYRFDQIAVNVKEKKKPVGEDKRHYIGLEHLDSGSLRVSRWGSDVPLKGEKLIMHKGDVLFGKRNAYLRRTAIAPHDGLFSAHGMILRPNDELVCKEFFPFFISSDYFFDVAIKISVGSLSPTVNWRDLSKQEFELPPMEKQQELAQVLWAMEDVKEEYLTLLKVTEELVKSRFVEMFGDPIINNRGWQKSKLQNHVDVIVGYPFDSSKYTTEGIPIVGGYNLMQGIIQWENSKFWKSADGYESYLLKDKDIVIAMDRPWVGNGFKIATIKKVDLPAILIQRTACIRCKSISPEFLYILLDSLWFANHCQITGSLVPHISNKDILSYEIILPPLDLQNRFVNFAKQADKSKFDQLGRSSSCLTKTILRKK